VSYRNKTYRFLHNLAELGGRLNIPKIRGITKKLLLPLSEPRRFRKVQEGYEDHNFPGTYEIWNKLGSIPDIVHMHNLHGEYFDLRALPEISKNVPTFITLHDAWLLSGHCAHSFDCERWKSGCGSCPDLNIPPRIKKDRTEENWALKKEVFANSSLYIASPCQWMADKVMQSILKPAVKELRVIPNGIDTDAFKPYPKSDARDRWGLSKDRVNILMRGPLGQKDLYWRDDETLIRAFELLSTKYTSLKFDLYCYGGAKVDQTIGKLTIKSIGYFDSKEDMAEFLSATDLYIHASSADTYPNTILEVMSCGVPVLASDVGGINEQIEPGVNGFLYKSGDVDGLYQAIENCIEAPACLGQMGENAAAHVRKNNTLGHMTNAYLSWFREIIK
jgi:glycosyltransferase involved in cell wall biosynthesis